MSRPRNLEKDESVEIAATSTEILAANPDRTGWLIHNTGSQSVYIKQGGAAAETTHHELAVDAVLRGSHGEAIYGIVASSTGEVWVTAEGDA